MSRNWALREVMREEEEVEKEEEGKRKRTMRPTS
jgi:hypothetical protein